MNAQYADRITNRQIPKLNIISFRVVSLGKPASGSIYAELATINLRNLYRKEQNSKGKNISTF